MDQGAQNDLVAEHTAFAERVVGRLMRSMSLPYEMREELMSAGMLGLVEAASRFDSSSGKRFTTFAFLRVRGAVIDYLRDNSEISGAAYKQAQAYRAANDYRVEVAEQGEMNTLEDVFSFAAAGALVYRLSFEETDLPSKLEDGEGSMPDAGIKRTQTRELLKQKLSKLSEKERLIVESHYFGGKSFVEIVRDNPGLSKSWVSRLHSRALKKLLVICQEERDALC